jgi:hypothetical protein
LGVLVAVVEPVQQLAERQLMAVVQAVAVVLAELLGQPTQVVAVAGMAPVTAVPV